ncbi:probable methyltransferase-like protein 24 [Daphnia pulex]|uniref:probable methyltransferase-like protein 24 n=1 Tax=Daphnia pulex TaxID=6669 RepID=UPI001EE11434|nr:probable methyltransferase-like protein 24 [Daphnia pulex]
MQYFMWSNQSSCKLQHGFGGIVLLNPSGIAGKKAVCIDSQIAPTPKKCLVYSFGINNEWSFDEQMESYGCEVFSFDPSMGMSHHNHSPGIHFYNWGLGDRDEYDNVFNWTIRSLSSIYNSLYAIHGNEIIDYLKIDIENSEWIALPDIIQTGMLSKVRQLGIEVHLNSEASIEQYRKWAQILRAIEKLGMTRFHSEYNPWFMGNFTEFEFWGSFGHEISWYNRNLFHEGSFSYQNLNMKNT